MPKITNAVVNTTAQAGAPKLVGAAAMITAPSPLELAQYGGVISHILLLDPSYNGIATDIATNDFVYIQSWGKFTVNTSKAYRVIDATMAGGLGLELWRVIISERVQG